MKKRKRNTTRKVSKLLWLPGKRNREQPEQVYRNMKQSFHIYFARAYGGHLWSWMPPHGDSSSVAPVAPPAHSLIPPATPMNHNPTHTYVHTYNIIQPYIKNIKKTKRNISRSIIIWRNISRTWTKQSWKWRRSKPAAWPISFLKTFLSCFLIMDSRFGQLES